MRLHRLDITAFGPFGGSQRVDFDALSAAGLFLLHGPTGAGKTPSSTPSATPSTVPCPAPARAARA